MCFKHPILLARDQLENTISLCCAALRSYRHMAFCLSNGFVVDNRRSIVLHNHLQTYSTYINILRIMQTTSKCEFWANWHKTRFLSPSTHCLSIGVIYSARNQFQRLCAASCDIWILTSHFILVDKCFRNSHSSGICCSMRRRNRLLLFHSKKKKTSVD